MEYDGGLLYKSEGMVCEFSDMSIGTPIQNGAWNPEASPGFYQRNRSFESSWVEQPAFYHSTPAAPPPPPPPQLPQGITHNPALSSHVYGLANCSPVRGSPSSGGGGATRPLGKRGKPKRVRTAFTSHQLLELEAVFRKTTYVSRTDRSELSARLGLKDRAIKVWFQNRRMKHKKDGFGGKLSSEEGSPPPPEVCSSTSDLYPDSQSYQYQHAAEYKPLAPITYDPSFASPQAQEIFTRAVAGYENSHSKQQHYIHNHRNIDSFNFIETYQYDNISPVPQYSENYSAYENEHSMLYAKQPDSTTPAFDTTAILNGIEMDMAANRDDSGLVSMNSESLDKLGALVSQCITSEIVDISSSDDICLPQVNDQIYLASSNGVYVSEDAQTSFSDKSVAEFLKMNPTERDIANEREAHSCEPAGIVHDIASDIIEYDSDRVTFVKTNDIGSAVEINVAEIPLPGEIVSDNAHSALIF